MAFNGGNSNQTQNGFVEGTIMNNANAGQHSSVTQQPAAFGNQQWSWSGSEIGARYPHSMNMNMNQWERSDLPNMNHYGSMIPTSGVPIPGYAHAYAHAHATIIPPPPPPALPKIPYQPPLPTEDVIDLTQSPSPPRELAVTKTRHKQTTVSQKRNKKRNKRQRASLNRKQKKLAKKLELEQQENSHPVGQQTAPLQKQNEVVDLLDDTDNDDMDISDDSEEETERKNRIDMETSKSLSESDANCKMKALLHVDAARTLGEQGGDDNGTKYVSSAHILSASSIRQSRGDRTTTDTSSVRPSSRRIDARSPIESNELIEKRERLKRTLMRAELERAKAQLAILQMQKEEALKNAKALLFAAKLRKEGALKRNSSFLAEKYSKATKKISDVSQDDDLADISAFPMKSLLIINIGLQGTDDEFVRQRPIESITVFNRSNSNGLQESNDTSEISSEKNEVKVVPSNQAAKLRLDLELAKRRLQLAGLQKKRLEAKQKPAPVESHDLISKKTLTDQAEIILATSAKATVQDLLKRQQELRSNIKASREAQKELKNGQDISHLRQMIQKQQALLSHHGNALKNCTALLQQTKVSLEAEKEAYDQGEVRLRDLLQRKSSSERMVRNVSSKIMKLRRKRDKDAAGHNKGKGGDGSI